MAGEGAGWVLGGGTDAPPRDPWSSRNMVNIFCLVPKMLVSCCGELSGEVTAGENSLISLVNLVVRLLVKLLVNLG